MLIISIALPAYFVRDDKSLQETASNMDAFIKLGQFLIRLEHPAGPYETHQAASERLRQQEGALFAISAICADLEELRRKVLEHKLLPHIIIALSSPSSSVRCAALQCTRSLSRSINILKTAFLDTNAAPAFFDLLAPEQGILIHLATSAVMCNVFLEFSPLKTVLLDMEGIVARVVNLTKINRPTKGEERNEEKTMQLKALLRHHALTAVKNMTYWASSRLKINTTECLTWEYIVA